MRCGCRGRTTPGCACDPNQTSPKGRGHWSTAEGASTLGTTVFLRRQGAESRSPCPSVSGCPLAPWLPGNPALRELQVFSPGLGPVPPCSPSPGGVARPIPLRAHVFRTSACPQLAPAPGGQVGSGAGWEFPARGSGCPVPGLFLFTERKGKWKRRGGGGWSPLRRPSAGSDAVDSGADEGVWSASVPGLIWQLGPGLRATPGAGRPGSLLRRRWSGSLTPGSRLPTRLRREPSGIAAGSAPPAGRAEPQVNALWGLGYRQDRSPAGCLEVPTLRSGEPRHQGVGCGVYSWGLAEEIARLPAAALRCCARVVAAAGTAGKHLAQGSLGALPPTPPLPPASRIPSASRAGPGDAPEVAGTPLSPRLPPRAPPAQLLSPAQTR